MNTAAKIPKQFQCPCCGSRIIHGLLFNSRVCESLGYACHFRLYLVWIHLNPETVKPLDPGNV